MMMCGIPKYPRHHANAEIADIGVKVLFPVKALSIAEPNSPLRARFVKLETLSIALPKPPSVATITIPEIMKAMKIKLPWMKSVVQTAL